MSMAETKDPAGSNTPPVAPSSGGKSARERGGWLAKIAPGIRNLVTKRDTPENLWVKCPDTGEMIYRPDLEAALWVTPAGRHMRIGPALRFAALLALILLMVEGAQHWLGDVGVYLVALLSGLADVDAITLSLARSAKGELHAQVAVQGIFLAALSNSLVKGFLVALIGGRKLALMTLPVMAAGLLAGAAALLLLG